MRDIRYHLGERIRQLRLARGLSQEGLAERSGLHTTQVQRIEQGKLNPRLTTLSCLAGGLGTSLSHLFGDTRGEADSRLLKDLNSLLAGRPQGEQELVVEIARVLLNRLPQSKQ